MQRHMTLETMDISYGKELKLTCALQMVKRNYNFCAMLPLAADIKISVPYELIKVDLNGSIDSLTNSLNLLLRGMPHLVIPPAPMETYPSAPTMRGRALKGERFLDDKKNIVVLVYFLKELKVHTQETKEHSLTEVKMKLGLILRQEGKTTYKDLTEFFNFQYPYELYPVNKPLGSMTPGMLTEALVRGILIHGFDIVDFAPVDLNGIPPQTKEEVKQQIESERDVYMSIRRSTDDFDWSRRFIKGDGVGEVFGSPGVSN